MGRKTKTIKELTAMAKLYQIQDNALLQKAIEQYSFQLEVIEKIKKQLKEKESLLTTKEYVKGRENISVNPLVKELPKHSDSANKTAALILSMIESLGKEPKQKRELDAFINA